MRSHTPSFRKYEHKHNFVQYALKKVCKSPFIVSMFISFLVSFVRYLTNPQFLNQDESISKQTVGETEDATWEPGTEYREPSRNGIRTKSEIESP